DSGSPIDHLSLRVGRGLEGRSVAVLPVRSRGRAGPPVVRSRPAAGRPPVVRSVLVVRPAGAVRAAAGSRAAAGPGPQPVRRYAGAGGSDFDESPPSVADKYLSYEYCQPAAVSLRKSTRLLSTRRTRSSASCVVATPRYSVVTAPPLSSTGGSWGG